MEKNRWLPKKRSLFVITFAVMAMVISTAAYAQQKSITLAGIPNTYRNKIAMLALAPSPGSSSYTAYSLGTISGASATFALSDWTTDKPWNGSGNFAFIIIIGETAQAIAGKQYLYTGQTAATSSVSQAATTIQWSQFVSAGQQAAPQQPAAQKSITLKGLPGNYRGKTAMLALTPAPNNQSYVAYSLGTISDPKTITFPLSDWTTDNPWGGSGNFAFIIIIGETAQAIANSQFLYTGQTKETANVNQNDTTIQWYQFAFLPPQSITQQPAQQPGRQPGRQQSGGQQPSSQQPPAASFAGYIITGSGTAFSATKGGASIGIADGKPIKDVIGGIKAHSNGQPCEIRFGDGVTPLNIGTEGVSFNNLFGGKWGLITISGKITSSYSGWGAAVEIGGDVSVTSTADIINTSTAERSITVSVANDATFTIVSGKISTAGKDTTTLAVYNRSNGTVNMTGGTVEVTGVDATGIENSEGTVNISGGTVVKSAAGRAAVYNSIGKDGVINISGGTIDGGKNSMSAVYSVTRGKVTVSGTAIITSANPAAEAGALWLGPNMYANEVRLEMTGGTVRNTSGAATGNAIRSDTYGLVNITGGTVSSPKGNAINNTGNSKVTLDPKVKIEGNKLNVR